MRAGLIALIVAIVVAALAAAYYFGREPPQLPPAAAPSAPPPSPVKPAGPRFPVVAPTEAPPALPPLRESDAALQEAIGAIVGDETLRRLFNVDDIVRRIVATVDNLPRKSYAQRLSPAKPVGGQLATKGRGDTLVVAPENAARYAPWVALLQRVDAKRAAATYQRFYPLFQQAYVELGYPEGYFNDRLVEVIDHLLATPDVNAPLRLTVPHVLYEYADPDLETRSAGQKLLLRLGPANAAAVKSKLRELRREIAPG